MIKYSSLQEIYQDPTFSEYGKPCDTHLKTDDGTVFQVHSKLLSRKSKYFNALFSISEEIGQSTVIHGIEPGVFEIILVYLYTGRLRLTTENMLHLLVASDFFMLDPLLNVCNKFVLQHKTVENCLILYFTAYRIKSLNIERQCRRFFLLCFEKVIRKSANEALHMPFGALKHFLSNRSLNVSCERLVWSFIEAWILMDPVNRLPNIPELLKFLSIKEIDASLAWDIISSPIVQKVKPCDHLGHLDEALEYLNYKCRAKHFVLQSNKPPFVTNVRLPRCLYIVSKNSSQRLVAEIFVSYDESLDFCRKLGEMPLNRGGFLGVEHRVYILRESDFGRRVFTGRTYDLLENEMKATPTCPHNHLHVVAEVGGCVYALGIFGMDMYRHVDGTDEWVNVCPMQEMSIQGGVGLNGFLYVVGEMDQMVMQRYDPSTDSWSITSPPMVRRYNTTAVAYRGKIFLIGGERELFLLFDEDDQEDEEIDFDEDDEDVELEVVDPNVDYMDAEEDNLDDDDEDDEEEEDFVEDDNDDDDDWEDEVFFSRDVEVYDPATDEWVFYPELPFQCESIVAAVIKERLYVYNNYQSSVAYWDGSGEWHVVDNQASESQLFQYRFCTVEKEEVVKELMKRNRGAHESVWIETGLEKEMG